MLAQLGTMLAAKAFLMCGVVTWVATALMLAVAQRGSAFRAHAFLR